ncbi:phosphoinositide 3-kinase adapter protein 1 isoform X2 [Microplitis mediator]|uniref:phosphoinositide 3-kinase adapter protein 1 isoform X2 n=1 Tax=Microplitis mediator TaxID=375433 RepID=UPI0025549C18|nr:phosphoinositide 3-kinase adapter protein 1 isoform X2 [Microplitis mediator]
MALDNPSYFSLLGNSISPEISEGPSGSSGRSFVTFFKKRPSRMGTSTSTTTSGTTCALLMGDNNKNLLSAEECQPMLSRATANTNGPRRSFRSLFRSLSANTDNEKTLQILKGDPRPADVAPPSPYLPHRSHSHSDHDRKNRPSRRRTLKSASELLSNDMIFCGLPGEDPANNSVRSNANGSCNRDPRHYRDNDEDDDTDGGEVFLGINDARYYNLSATLPAPGSSGNRRHSIGCSSNFVSEEQNLITRRGAVIQTEGFIREPDTIAPPIPVDQVDCGKQSKSVKCKKHKSKGSRSRSGGTKIEGTNASLMEEREDVVFISSKDSQASALWVNYLTACFEQISRQQGRPPFKVRHVAIEDATAISSTVHEKISKARLQIIVVCPILLERASNKPEQASTLAKQLAPERVLAMMLGVHDGHLTESQKTALITYSQWRKFFVKDQDETFVGEFLGAAVSILGSAPSAALKSDKTTFSIHPKKVKMGQSRVLAILNDPLRPEDSFNVIVDRCGEGTEITQVKKRNPYTLQFSIPERCLEVSMLVGVRVIVNGMPQGVRQVKCESRLRELDQILRAHDNPLEFMCQTFGFGSGDREQLDNWMVHAFQKNVPPRFNLLATPSGSAPLQKNTISQEEYPTLLHFAARFGLEKLAWQLLDCPGGEIACDLKNVSELTPAELAEQAGHTKLAHQLRGYMQMNEFTNMYSYLKVISENTSGTEANNESAPVQLNSLDTEHDKEDYCQPRPISEAYLVPPAARPVITSASISCTPPQLPPPNPTTSPNLCEMNYSIVPPPTPVLGPLFTPPPTSTSTQSTVNFEANGPKLTSAPITAPLMALKPTMSQSLRKDFPISREDFMNSHLPNLGGSLNRSTSYPGTKSREPSGPQDELLEIINDFKNNVFTISEVERLVENWRNRNDVQQSFKDKQRQLASMRDEYERIQKKMKDEMKAPTPFDRFKKLFTKSKKDSKESSSASSQDDDTASTHSKTDNKSNGTLSDRRPISSLSLHSVSSSSSSGRMSVISGCSGTSLGDSGTHSDTEDRRLRNSREDKGGMMTYEIPPAPKPFTGRYSPLRYTPSPRSSTNCIDEHRRHPTPSNEYYIAFPVSGLPIHSFNADGSAVEPKTPSSPCDHSFSPSMSIPEEQSHGELNENNECQKEIKDINQLSIPSPPPSPPTHIPLDYINITPTVNSNDLQNVLVNSDVNNSCDNKKTNVNSDVEASEVSGEVLNKVINSKDHKNPEDETVNHQDTHIQSNHVESLPLDIDVVDAPVLHDYMNIQPCDQDPRVVGVIPKKPPAPPVPPRAPSKK